MPEAPLEVAIPGSAWDGHDLQMIAFGSAPPRPHDLLWVTDPMALQCDVSLPRWAQSALRKDTPLVVRRDVAASPNLVPVGLRGKNRSERLGGWVSRDCIVRRVGPEDLRSDGVRRSRPSLAHLPALRALAKLAPALEAIGLAWGPTGSVGYALATGLPVLRAESDLDLLVRAPCKPNSEQRAQLIALAAGAGHRLDIQIDSGRGAFAFAEWAAGGERRRVLLKTNHGPVLTDDPWDAADPPRIRE